MSSTSKPKTKRIVFLLLCAVLLPIAGYFIAADIEDTQSSPSGGLLAWSTLCLAGLGSLYIAHRIALKNHSFKALGSVALIASLVFVGTWGWIANSAWYNYYFFTEYVYPEFSVQQDDEYPNQFLFKGPLLQDSGNTVIRKILSADNVDWNQPVSLELHSDGGSPQEAILLAEFVKHYKIQIEVMGQCISACTLVLLSSDQRYIHPRAWVGFHAAYMKKAGAKPNYDQPHLRFYDKLLEIHLKRLKTSQDFQDKAKIQDAAGGFYPSYDALVEAGIANQKSRLYLDDDKVPGYL